MKTRTDRGYFLCKGPNVLTFHKTLTVQCDVSTRNNAFQFEFWQMKKIISDVAKMKSTMDFECSYKYTQLY